METKAKNITLPAIRKIADKYELSWYQQSNGWVINGIQQHYSYKANNAGEKAALVDYMVNWGRSAMSEADYAIVLTAQTQIQG